MYQLEDKSSLISNDFLNTIDKYMAWELKNFIYLTIERFKNDVWIYIKHLY